MTGGRLGSRLWWGFVPLAALLWGVGALGSAALPGLTQSPLLTQVAVPGAAYARDVALALTAGAVVIALLGGGARLRRWALGWAVVALALAVIAVMTLQADIRAEQIGLDNSDLALILRETAVGQAMLLQVGCIAVTALLVAVSMIDTREPRRERGLLALALLGVAIAIAAPPVAGHAGVTNEHVVAGVSTGVHAVAVSLWIGGLAVVSVACLMGPDRAPVVLPRFSLLALLCVLVAAETGLLTATLVVGALGDLLGSSYGGLVVAKGVLLAWLIRFGWLQRRRAIDHLPERSVPQTVATIAGVELLLMATALAASVVLVRLGPPPIPSTGFAPLSLVTLGIAAPMLALRIRPRGWRISDALPEAAMVVFLLVVIEVGGVGLMRTALGPFGLLVELALLVSAGWCALSSARQSRIALGLGVVGLPVALTVNVWLGDVVPWRMSVIAAVLGIGLLMLWWRLERRTQATTNMAVSVA